MTPIKREPIYHSDRRYRIVSAPNGLWQAQHNRNPDQPGQRGDPKVKGKPWTPHDPWEAIAKPTSYAVAEVQMNEAAGMQQQMKAAA